MPFDLKNAGDTYQKAMTIIFCDFLHKLIECYAADSVIKTKDRENDPHDLKRSLKNFANISSR